MRAPNLSLPYSVVRQLPEARVELHLLIVCDGGIDPVSVCRQALIDALADFEDLPGDPEELVLERYALRREDGSIVCGVAVNLSYAQDLDRSVAAIVATCRDADGVAHLLKLFDPSLSERHRQYAGELFEIEMQLREALTVIFLSDGRLDYYSLLSDATVSPAGGAKNVPHEEQMRGAGENEFFHILFSDYIALEMRKVPGQNEMIKLIAEVDDFRDLQRRMSPERAMREKDRAFLAEIKALVQPVEALRNAVAHNREIPRTVRENYQQTLPRLTEALTTFLRDPA
jgi:hypothetical protein